jgi:hypothetical protein
MAQPGRLHLVRRIWRRTDREPASACGKAARPAIVSGSALTRIVAEISADKSQAISGSVAFRHRAEHIA